VAAGLWCDRAVLSAREQAGDVFCRAAPPHELGGKFIEASMIAVGLVVNSSWQRLIFGKG
jgi:hypothetical protein